MTSFQNIPWDERALSFVAPDFLTPLNDDEAMGLALSFALQGAGRVGKNPMVGAIALDSLGRFLGGGFHAGGPHAEVMLIEHLKKIDALRLLDGARIFVTLEPCAHFGKTPPCADLLVQFPIAKVIYGQKDPFPEVNGRGLAKLEAHNIACEHYGGVHSKDFSILTQVFFHNVNTGKPFVALKAATTLDGSFCVSGDERSWITSERSRNYAHWLRLYYDAILIGIKTAILDNPTLNIRAPGVFKKPTTRIVLDPKATLVADPGFTNHPLNQNEGCTYWIVSQNLSSQFATHNTSTCKIVGLPEENNKFIHDQFLDWLMSENIRSVLLEGGAGVWEQFWNEHNVNALHLFMAPKIWGRPKKQNWAKNFSCNGKLQNTKLMILGDDFLLEGQFA